VKAAKLRSGCGDPFAGIAWVGGQDTHGSRCDLQRVREKPKLFQVQIFLMRG
jgi:hypothetical protein